MDHDTASFGAVLRRFRTGAALSQEALAERAGLSLRGVSDLERGLRNAPHLATVGMLADALALGPEDRQALLAAARPQSPSDLPERAPPRGFAPLPLPLTPLIGRERELAALIALVGISNQRLVTVTGVGGSGKTRLTLEAGARLRDEFPDGAVFVDLAPLTEASLVVPAIAAALGVREQIGERLADTLARFLATKRALLIVDNCEQVLAAAPDLAVILTASPRVSLLATSRAPLRVRGEREFPLLPLSLPTADPTVSLDELGAVPAVALFVERARACQPAFAISAENAADIVAICGRLDGLPLALELAAARVKVLPPRALLRRLDRRLTVLTGGSRDLPARQRTMHTAIAWSYDLLAEPEQSLFRRLSVFVGGATIEAIEAVGDHRDGTDVLELLQALVASSLVQTSDPPDGERRFTILETVREFGIDRLQFHAETRDAKGRHAHYFASLAEAGGAELAAAAPGPWLTRLEAEQANLRGALTWLRDEGETEAGLALASALGGYWRLHNFTYEGRRWLEAFLAQPTATQAAGAARIAALRWAGELAGLEGDVGIAEARLGQSLALARAAGDKRGMAGALSALGSVLFQHVDMARSIAPFEEAAALWRELGDLRQTAFSLAYLAGAVGIQGDLERGEALAAESAALLASLGDTRSFEVNFLALIRGWLALMRGDLDDAVAGLEDAIVMARDIDNKGIRSAALTLLGEAALVRGDWAAVDHFRDGLVAGWDVGFAVGVVANVQGLVWCGTRRGEFARAAYLIGVIDRLGGTASHYTFPATIFAAHHADVAAIREALGDETFATARERGRERPVAESIVEAMAFAEELSPARSAYHSI